MSVENIRHETDNNHEQFSLGFEDYRELCDSTDFFRKLGVMEKYQYEEALMDSRTSFLRIDAVDVPVLIPLKYEDRYNERLSQQMTGSKDVYLLALPCLEVQHAMENGASFVRGEDMGPDFSIVVEDYDAEGLTEERRADIARALSVFGNLVPGEFVDERLKDIPANRTAWMAIYDLVVESNRQPEQILRKGTYEERAMEAWDQYRQEHNIPELPDEHFDGNFFFSGKQLNAHPEIVDKLWGISEVGFGDKLGMYHPISMAVTKHFFDKHITSEGTFVCARYSEGEPLCFGFVAPSMNHNEWLNDQSTTFRDIVAGSEKSEADEDREMVVHFFELISKGQRGLGLANNLLILLQDLASRMSPKTRVVFESTNLSDLYIPATAEGTAHDNPVVTVTQPVEKIDTLNYWYLKAQ